MNSTDTISYDDIVKAAAIMDAASLPPIKELWISKHVYDDMRAMPEFNLPCIDDKPLPYVVGAYRVFPELNMLPDPQNFAYEVDNNYLFMKRP